jgi:hypothetical protein
VALSSAESELTAAVKTASEVIGMIGMARDMGVKVEGDIWVDASAAMGIVNRQGCGKIRHLDTILLWVQQRKLRKELGFEKINGKENPSDLMTKGLDEVSLLKMVEKLGCSFRGGRAETSVKLN